MVDTALDLPKPLQNMLGTLVCSHILSSWNICSSGQNMISVNIRFSQPAIGGSVVQPVYYRKQTTKQVNHNKARTHAYKQRLDSTARTMQINPSIPKEHEDAQPPPPPPPLSSPPHPTSPPQPSPPKTDSKKRKIDTLTPETFRLETTTSPPTVIDTPVKLSDIEQYPDSQNSPINVLDTPERCDHGDIDDGSAAADSFTYSVHPPVIPPSPPLSNPSLPILSPPPPPQPPDPLEGKFDPAYWYNVGVKWSTHINR